MSGQPAMDTTEQIFFHPDLLVVPSDGTPPYLFGYKCPGCGKTWFPKLETCPECWTKLDQIQLSRTGRLYSYTTVHVGARGVKTPYVIGYVDMPEDVRLFAHLDVEPGEAKCGMPVEVTYGLVRTEASGKQIISYRFKPVK